MMCHCQRQHPAMGEHEATPAQMPQLDGSREAAQSDGEEMLFQRLLFAVTRPSWRWEVVV